MLKVCRFRRADVAEITLARFGNARGYCGESWSGRAMAEAGFNSDYVENHPSYSAVSAVLRALQFWAPPFGR